MQEILDASAKYSMLALPSLIEYFPISSNFLDLVEPEIKKYLSDLFNSWRCMGRAGQVRAAVRSWLKLPHDTPKAYFHASILDGGLGIVCLELQIPLLKIKGIERL